MGILFVQILIRRLLQLQKKIKNVFFQTQVSLTVVSVVYWVQPPMGVRSPLQNLQGPLAFQGHFSPNYRFHKRFECRNRFV